MSANNFKNFPKRFPIRNVTHGVNHYFFGYYDVNPWNSSGQVMLTMEVEFIDRFPREEDVATIGLVHLQDSSFEKIAETRAWNWQQGARLQWVPWESESCVAYNDRDDGQIISFLHNTVSGSRERFELPIYSLHPSRPLGLSLNFGMLLHKGYGYAGLKDPWAENMDPNEEGIFLINLQTGAHDHVISLAQLMESRFKSLMLGTRHWVNHLLFNPSGTRFAFIHRWQSPDAGTYSRLMTANLDGSDLYCLSDTGMISHFTWRDSKHILAWSRKKRTFSTIQKINSIGKGFLSEFIIFLRENGIPSWFRRRILDDKFILFTDQTHEVLDVANGILDRDGHPSYSPNGEWILTDTYPDDRNFQRVILYHTERNLRIDIGEFYSSPDYFSAHGAIRCDLHPRWNRDGTEICIDVNQDGKRQMYVMDVREVGDFR